MQLELNLWFSPKSGNLYGNLNINQKEQLQIIDRLRSIQDFCMQTIKENYADEDTLAEFINSEDRDHNALYSWTTDHSIICWNTKTEIATVIVKGQQYLLTRYNIKNRSSKAPDICFKGAA